MTGKERRLLAIAEKERFRSEVYAELGMTRADSALFTAIYYGFTIPPEDLPARAAQEDCHATRPAPTEQCRVALGACLAKGWLQVLDEQSLAKIAAQLQNDNVIGPIYGGIPEVG